MSYRLRTLLPGFLARYQLANAWLIAAMFWMIVPLFMLAAALVSLEAVESRPIWAAGNFAAGQIIGITVLWMTVRMVKWARQEYREMMRKDANAADKHWTP